MFWMLSHSDTVLLLPAPTATVASVEAVLDRWTAEEAELTVLSRTPQRLDRGGKTLGCGASGEVEANAMRSLTRKRQHSDEEEVEAGAKRRSVTRLTASQPARRSGGRSGFSAAAGLAGGKGVEKRRHTSRQGMRPSCSAAGAAPPGAGAASLAGLGAGADRGVARILRVMLLTHAESGEMGSGMVTGSGGGGGGGSMAVQPHCIGAVEVLAGMTLGQLATTICDDIGVEAGFRMRIGARVISCLGCHPCLPC